jgi:hypothetical protein
MAKKNIIVSFPPLSGGEAAGFNDAGIEQFQRDQVESLVRECTQNSTDSPISAGEKVRIEFHLLEVDVAKLEFMPELTTHIQSCYNCVNQPARRGKEVKALSFFKKALNITKSNKVQCLLIRDYNTTGLSGDDTDEAGKWHTLVKTRGSSNKNNAASGGSFGIGKNAPFACSALRTVIYGTRTEGGVAWQGKSLLITHPDPNSKQKTQGVGFIGIKNKDEFFAIRDGSMPCELMKRKNDEFGTDILVLGFEYENWQDQLVGSAIKHFWPSLQKDMLEFRVVDHINDSERIVNRRSLDNDVKWLLSAKPIDIDEFNEHYLDVYRAPPVILDVLHLGKCKFYLSFGGEKEHTKSVCCFRNNRMVIEYMNIRQSGNFTAVFECDNSDGSALLKNLEPPRHDKWDKDQPQDEKDKYRELYNDMREKMRSEIEKKLIELVKDTTDPDDIDLGSDDGDARGQEGLSPRFLLNKKTKHSVPSYKNPGTVKPPPKGEGGKGDNSSQNGRENVSKPDSDGINGYRFVRENLRCLLSLRKTDSCEYRIILPKGIAAGEALLKVEAIGYDGGNMPVEILNMSDGHINLKGGETFVSINVKGPAMALNASISLRK